MQTSIVAAPFLGITTVPSTESDPSASSPLYTAAANLASVLENSPQATKAPEILRDLVNSAWKAGNRPFWQNSFEQINTTALVTISLCSKACCNASLQCLILSDLNGLVISLTTELCLWIPQPNFIDSGVDCNSFAAYLLEKTSCRTTNSLVMASSGLDVLLFISWVSGTDSKYSTFLIIS